MKQAIKLNESQLRKIVAESVKRVIIETNIFSSEKPQYDIHGKRWNKEYDKASDVEFVSDSDIESEKAAKEFLNRQNAAQDFKHFPRYSKWDSGEKDYDALKNGSTKIQALKQQREEEKRDREAKDYLERMYKIAKKAVIPFTRREVTDEEKVELEEMPDKWGWFEVRDDWEKKCGNDYGETKDIPPFWLYAAKIIYNELKSDFES